MNSQTETPSVLAPTIRSSRSARKSRTEVVVSFTFIVDLFFFTMRSFCAKRSAKREGIKDSTIKHFLSDP